MKDKKQEAWQSILTLFFLMAIIIFLVIIVNIILQKTLLKNYDFCDYDSCSQESEYWEVNGSKCFDSNNLECAEFLKLWDACQHYKERLGVC